MDHPNHTIFAWIKHRHPSQVDINQLKAFMTSLEQHKQRLYRWSSEAENYRKLISKMLVNTKDSLLMGSAPKRFDDLWYHTWEI